MGATVPSGPGAARLVAAAILSAGLTACSAPHQPDVVFVTLDTLSLRYVSPYGAAADLTPNLTVLASQGTLFEHAYTQVPLTLPSHTTLFSGRDPASTGVLHNRDRVPPELATLPELLAASGYRTGGFISLGVLNSESGFSRGFEAFADPFPPGAWPWYRNADEVLADVEPWLARDDPRPLFAWVHFSDPHGPYLPPEVDPDCELLLDGETLGRFALATTERFAVDLELSPGRHTLTWRSLRSTDTDGRRQRKRNVLSLTPEPSPALDLAAEPLDFGERLLTPETSIALQQPADEVVAAELVFRGSLLHPPVSEARANYRSEVRALDRAVGRLREAIAAARADRPALWVVVSDHGEGLRHHDSMGHADEVFEDQLRIAWILTGPAVPKGLRVSGGPFLNDSVMPTVLDLLDLPSPAGTTGRSLTRCLAAAGCAGRGPWWGYGVPPRRAAPLPIAGYRWPYKLVDEGGELPTVFDLATDPWEASPLDLDELRSERAVVELVRELPQGRRLWANLVRPAGESAVDPQREEALRALGYLND